MKIASMHNLSAMLATVHSYPRELSKKSVLLSIKGQKKLWSKTLLIIAKKKILTMSTAWYFFFFIKYSAFPNMLNIARGSKSSWTLVQACLDEFLFITARHIPFSQEWFNKLWKWTHFVKFIIINEYSIKTYTLHVYLYI